MLQECIAGGTNKPQSEVSLRDSVRVLLCKEREYIRVRERSCSLFPDFIGERPEDLVFPSLFRLLVFEPQKSSHGPPPPPGEETMDPGVVEAPPVGDGGGEELGVLATGTGGRRVNNTCRFWGSTVTSIQFPNW